MIFSNLEKIITEKMIQLFRKSNRLIADGIVDLVERPR